MSAYTTGWVLRNSPVTGAARLVLIVLADRSDHDGRNAYPSVASIAREAACTPSTVHRVLRELEANGHIEREGTTHLRTTNYRVTMRPSEDRTPSDPAGRGSDPASADPPRIGPEPSSEPSGEPSSGKSARASASDEVPEDFPDELRPHAKIVYRILVAVAEHHNAKAVSAKALAHVIMARPRHPLVKAAHDWAAHWLAKPSLRDAVAAYRNWLDRCSPLASTEHLPGQEPSLPENVRRIGSRPMSNADRVEAQIQAMRAKGEEMSAGSSDTFGST